VHEQCEQCGFDGAAYDAPALLAAIRALGTRWRELLDTAGPRMSARPAPEVWSALEYAAHTRDVTALHAFGVEQALTVDEPVFPEVEPGLADSAATSYHTEDPTAVLDALDMHATRLARLADDAGESAWTRGLTLGDNRSDVRRLLEHALHDSLHHVDDVERGLK
jgi:hypothetical protein